MAAAQHARELLPPTLRDIRALGVEELRTLCESVGVDLEILGEFSDVNSVEDLSRALAPFCQEAAGVSPEAFAANLAGVEGPVSVVFLDVDGVLNAPEPRAMPELVLEEGCLARVARLLRDEGARVVLSTSWRSDPWARIDLRNAFISVGLPPDIIVGQTLEDPEDRPGQIRAWLDASLGVDPKSWVVLDKVDFSKCPVVREHFVRTDFQCGISDSDVVAAQTILRTASCSDQPRMPATLAELQALPDDMQRRLGEHLGVENASRRVRDDLIDSLLHFCPEAAPMLPDAFALNLAAAPEQMRIIFLDVDGVLNNGTSHGDPDTMLSATRYMILSRKCLKRFVDLVRDTDSRIVLSSTWRSTLALKVELHTALVQAGLPTGVFVGQTPEIFISKRGSEIMTWLGKLSSERVSAWTVIDDMNLSGTPELDGHFVWIDPQLGLVNADADRAKEILLSGGRDAPQPES